MYVSHCVISKMIMVYLLHDKLAPISITTRGSSSG